MPYDFFSQLDDVLGSTGNQGGSPDASGLFGDVTGGSSSVDLTDPQSFDTLDTSLPVLDNVTSAGLGSDIASALVGGMSPSDAVKLGKKAYGYGKKLGKYFGPSPFRRSYRRINPLNPRALRRSIRRLKGFEHFAKSVLHFTHPKQHVGGFKMNKRRRR